MNFAACDVYAWGTLQHESGAMCVTATIADVGWSTEVPRAGTAAKCSVTSHSSFSDSSLVIFCLLPVSES